MKRQQFREKYGSGEVDKLSKSSAKDLDKFFEKHGSGLAEDIIRVAKVEAPHIIKRMEEKHGAGFFGDLWKGVKSVGSKVVDAVKGAWPEIKKSGILSGIASRIHPLAGEAARLAGVGEAGRKKKASVAVGAGRPRKLESAIRRQV